MEKRLWAISRNPLTGLNLLQPILRFLEGRREIHGRNPLTGLNLLQPYWPLGGA